MSAPIKKLNILWILILVFFFLIVLIFNIRGYYYTCTPASDISIFQEAILKIANAESFNPYIQMRGLRFFNDHFDPIIFLGSLWVILTSDHIISILVFQIAFWFSMVLMVIILFRKEPLQKILIAVTMIIFCRGLIGGLIHPLHPVTWAMFPAFILTYFIHKKNDIGIIITSLILLTFKEIFCFGILFLSFYFLWKKKYKLFLPLFMMALLNLVFLYGFRSTLIGETSPYSKRILLPLMENPLNFFSYLLRSIDYKEYFMLLVSFFLPILYIIKDELWANKNWSDHFLIPILFYLVPFFGIHILSNSIFNWHGVSFVAPLLGVVIFSGCIDSLRQHRIILILTLLVFAITASRHQTKAIKLGVLGKSKHCTISDEKITSINNARTFIWNLPPSDLVLASSGFIPWGIRSGRYFEMAGRLSEKRIDHDYMILEKNDTGFTSPLTSIDIKEIIPLCSGSEIIQNDYYIYIAKGPFSKSCYERLFVNWMEEEMLPTQYSRGYPSTLN